MKNRIVKHSSRYSGPAGDSRPSAEIFAGMAAREKRATKYAARLRALLDEIMRDATLMMWESRAQLVRNVVVDWLAENDPDFAERKKASE